MESQPCRSSERRRRADTCTRRCRSARLHPRRVGLPPLPRLAASHCDAKLGRAALPQTKKAPETFFQVSEAFLVPHALFFLRAPETQLTRKAELMRLANRHGHNATRDH